MKIVFSTSRNPNFFSRAIKWYTKSKWSHVFLKLDDKIQKDGLIIESAGHGGVHIDVFSKHKDKILEVYQLKNDYNDIRCLYPYIGDNYGYLQIIGYPIAKLLNLKKNPFGGGYVCSELVLRWLSKSPLSKEFEHLTYNETTPQDLYEIISKSDSFIKL